MYPRLVRTDRRDSIRSPPRSHLPRPTDAAWGDGRRSLRRGGRRPPRPQSPGRRGHRAGTGRRTPSGRLRRPSERRAARAARKEEAWRGFLPSNPEDPFHREGSRTYLLESNTSCVIERWSYERSTEIERSPKIFYAATRGFRETLSKFSPNLAKHQDAAQTLSNMSLHSPSRDRDRESRDLPEAEAGAG